MARSRGLSRLVGRADEMAALESALARAAIADVVGAAHRTIERVGALAWLPFLAEEEAWLAEVAR